jgi:hypothetical protein
VTIEADITVPADVTAMVEQVNQPPLTKARRLVVLVPGLTLVATKVDKRKEPGGSLLALNR